MPPGHDSGTSRQRPTTHIVRGSHHHDPPNRIPLICHSCGVSSKTQRYSEHCGGGRYICFHFGCCPESIVRTSWKTESGQAHAEDDGDVLWAVFVGVDLRMFGGSANARQSRASAPPAEGDSPSSSVQLERADQSKRPSAGKKADKEKKAKKTKKKQKKSSTTKSDVEEENDADLKGKKKPKHKKKSPKTTSSGGGKPTDLTLEESLTCEEVVKRKFQQAKENGQVIALDSESSDEDDDDDDSDSDGSYSSSY